MYTILKKIQKSAIKYADILTQVLKVDVEIVDSELTRIAGTGNYKNNIDKNLENEECIYRKSINTGENHIIIDDEKDEICKECPQYSRCIKKFKICVPITLNGGVIGAIGVIGFSDEQRKIILSNLETYLTLLEKIAGLISEEAYEHIENEKNVVMANLLTNLSDDFIFDNVLGTSSKIISIKKNILKVAKSTSTVLITGESGSGKEMFARAIHKYSDRNKGPFVAINCGSIPEDLLEGEMFGYEKEIFTGADPREKAGKFEIANGGTIFLDEIGDMPFYMQVKLLRVIQEREIIRVGSNDSIKVDIRIIAATNKKLEELIEEGKFREDLYYRLSVIPIELPSLRERIEDIKVLTYNFANKYSKMFNKDFVGIDGEIWNYMLKYSWPGNIRELQNTIEFMINMMDSNGIITKDIIPKRIIKSVENNICMIEEDVINLKQIEKIALEKAIKIYGKTTEGKKLAASKLGIGIATLYRKIDEYHLAAKG